MAKLGLAFVDLLDMTIELKEGSEAVVTVAMPAMGKGEKAESETKNGKWSQKDEKISITIEGDDEALECTYADDQLKCAGDDDMDFILKKKESE